MALNSVLFGDFSETEVEDLFSGGTRDLEFVWQKSQTCADGSGGEIIFCPPDGPTPPPGPQLVDGVTSEFPSASVHILDIPEDLARPVYGSATASPKYPPNPPTTPEPPITSVQSKLNANAATFVPKFLIKDVKNDLTTSTASDSSKLHGRDGPSGLDRTGETKGQDQRGNGVGTNNRHIRSPIGSTTQTGETHSASSTPGISPCSTPVKQLGRDVSSPTTDCSAVGLSTKSPPPGVSAGPRSISPGGQEIQTRTEGPAMSSPTPTTPAQGGQTLISAAENLTIEGVSFPQTQPTGSNSSISIRTIEGRDGSVQSPPAHSTSTSSSTQQPAGQSRTLSPASSQASLASSSGQPSSLSDTAHLPTTTTPSDIAASARTSSTTSPTTSTNNPFPSPTTSSAPTPTPTPPPPPATNTPIPLSTLLTPAKPKSWASIVGGLVPPSGPPPSVSAPSPAPSSTVGQKGGPSATAGACAPSDNPKKSTGVQLDPFKCSSQLRSLGEQLMGVTIRHETVSIQPRGLINPGNWCYIHAPLQALLACPGVYHLLRNLNPYPTLSREPSATPLTDSMVQFVHEFDPYLKTATAPVIDAKPGSKKKRSSSRLEFLHGEPFRPDYIYDMLQKIKSNLSYKGRQEDTEEFLGRVLDGLHEEIVLAKKSLEEGSEGNGEGDGSVEGGGEEEEGEEGEWEQVGPKNKSTITRQTSFSESPITEIFGGELRSAVHRQGAKESATMEPFFSLQLDIQSEDIWTVKDALDSLAVKEIVQEIEAQKRITLSRLPPVLILHLKRFIFDKAGGSQKLQKQVQYSTDLEIGKDLLAPAIKSKLTPAQRSYRLWSVVYHHGKFATGGHYTCDVYHPSCGGWVRMDDSIVKLIPEELVLKHGQASTKVAYLLFYRRLDLIRTP